MSEIVRIAEQAHMAGQYSAGVDPSYSEARAYCSGLEFPTVDELKAHVERLREALIYAKGALDNYPIDDEEEKIIDGVLMETPTQSLNHIRAQVEEETIQADMEFLDDMACEHSGNLNNRPRKYKEQSYED